MKYKSIILDDINNLKLGNFSPIIIANNIKNLHNNKGISILPK